MTVDDGEMIRITREVGASEGLFVAPEGAACFAALGSLCSGYTISPEVQVVISTLAQGSSIWTVTSSKHALRRRVESDL